MSAVPGSSTTRRLGTTCGDLLSKEVTQPVGAALAAIQRASVAKDFRVEVRVGHDLQRRVQACGLFMAHENSSRATALGDGDALVAASDIINEPAELRLRLGQRKRLHDLTSLLTNRRFGKVLGSRGPGPLERAPDSKHSATASSTCPGQGARVVTSSEVADQSSWI